MKDYSDSGKFALSRLGFYDVTPANVLQQMEQPVSVNRLKMFTYMHKFRFNRLIFVL